MSFLRALWCFRPGERTRRRLQQRFGARVEAGVEIRGPLEHLTLGRDVQIQAGTFLHLGGMPWCRNAGSLRIGDGGVVSPLCVIYACGPGGVTIGRNFDCGPHVGIYASRTDYEQGPGHHVFAPVEIGDDVVVFANCVISPGVRIGNGAVLAAGSVVTRDVPARTLVGGAPARPIRVLPALPEPR